MVCWDYIRIMETVLWPNFHEEPDQGRAYTLATGSHVAPFGFAIGFWVKGCSACSALTRTILVP